MKLREVYFQDEETLFKWRKQDEQASWWQGDSVTEDSHGRWFHQRLVSPSVHIWISEVDNIPVGQVRVDSNGEISFSVDEAQRGQGYGTEMVKFASAATSHLHGRLKANVDVANEPGLKTLLSAGYSLRKDVVFLRWPE